MTAARELYWNIEGVWLFYVLSALAAIVFVVGVAVHISVWLKSTPRSRVSFSPGAWMKTLPEIFLGLRVFQGDVNAGTMHLLIFWGFLVLLAGTALLAVHEYIHSFLTGGAHLVFEVVTELGGLLLTAGLVWALVRRYIQRVPRLERRMEDGLVPVWLLVVVLSGFLLEGARVAAQRPEWSLWSFAGGWAGSVLSGSAALSLYPYLWWGHGLLSLGFIAVIPYTKLFHLLGAPASLYLRHAPAEEEEIPAFPSEPLEPPAEGDEALPVDFGEKPLSLGEVVFFDACMRCGRCVQACPSAGAGEPFAPRDFVQAARRALWLGNFRYGDIRLLSEAAPVQDWAAWHCTTCAACLEVCPVYGAAFKAVLRKRSDLIIEGKEVPDLMNQTLEKLFNYENPWVASKRQKGSWSKDLDVPALPRGGKEGQLCYFVGCTTSIDERAQGIARSFSSILKRAGVDFGTLGEKEPCCGDIARVAGEVGLFQEKMENCRSLFDQYGVEEVVTSSPHCFHTLSNEYAEKGFRVRHYAPVLRDLFREGRLQPKDSPPTLVTYHDPCYLGRHNRIFEEPREIIRAIPGMRLVEMAHHGPDSLCCGAGGGRMWQGKELDGRPRMSEIRIREAQATGARILVTACPLCLIMLEDASKTSGLEGSLKVMDLNELVLGSL
jgi:Fe-S oxidoreductase/nitrate reductase gamma subunit